MPKNHSAKTSARKLNETIFARFSIRSFFFFLFYIIFISVRVCTSLGPYFWIHASSKKGVEKSLRMFVWIIKDNQISIRRETSRKSYQLIKKIHFIPAAFSPFFHDSRTLFSPATTDRQRSGDKEGNGGRGWGGGRGEGSGMGGVEGGGGGRYLRWTFVLFFSLFSSSLDSNVKQNEAQSAPADSTRKGVNQRSKYVTQVQQQRPDLSCLR